MEGSAKRKVETICMTVLGLAVAGLMVFPIIWLGFSSFKPSSELFAYPLHLFPQAPTGESYISVVADGFFNYVKNSLFLAVVGTVITVVISAMCGYALAIYRKEIPYVNKVFAVFLLGTLIPGEILTIAQFTVVSEMGLYNNIWGCILPVVTTTTMGVDWNSILAASILSILPIIVIFIILQRYITGGLAASGVKG